MTLKLIEDRLKEMLIYLLSSAGMPIVGVSMPRRQHTDLFHDKHE